MLYIDPIAARTAPPPNNIPAFDLNFIKYNTPEIAKAGRDTKLYNVPNIFNNNWLSINTLIRLLTKKLRGAAFFCRVLLQRLVRLWVDAYIGIQEYASSNPPNS
jgi:hypothetical protein